MKVANNNCMVTKKRAFIQNKNVKQLRKKVQLSSKIGDLPRISELNKYLKDRDYKIEPSSEDKDLMLLGLWVKKWIYESD